MLGPVRSSTVTKYLTVLLGMCFLPVSQAQVYWFIEYREANLIEEFRNKKQLIPPNNMFSLLDRHRMEAPEGVKRYRSILP